MFDGSLPEVGDLAALVDAAAGWARTENAACARKTAVMAELFARRTGPISQHHSAMGLGQRRPSADVLTSRAI